MILKYPPIIKTTDYLNTDNIFFTSDFHLNHKNVIKFDNRPFKDVNEMSERIIENWNSVINKNSIIYFLGDLSFGSYKITKEFVHKLNGDIRIVLGNHDKITDLLRMERFSDIQNYKKLIININEIKETIILSHYPILMWDKKHYGSLHLHGHSHQNLYKSEDFCNKEFYKGKVLDVGLMGWNYTPISYNQVIEYFKTKSL